MFRDWFGSGAFRPPPNPPRAELSRQPPDLPPPRSPIAARGAPPARSAAVTWAKERSSPPALPRHQPKESGRRGLGKETLGRSHRCLKRGARCASRVVEVGGENEVVPFAPSALEGSTPGLVLGPSCRSGCREGAPTRPAAISGWLVRCGATPTRSAPAWISTCPPCTAPWIVPCVAPTGDALTAGDRSLILAK